MIGKMITQSSPTIHPSTKTDAAMTMRRSPQRCIPAKALSMTAARSRPAWELMRKD